MPTSATSPHPAKKRDAAAPAYVPGDADAERPQGDGSTRDEASGRPTEVGGQKGPEPTRYGDWEKGGRCTDF